eukprot:SAG31_NODE_747_length_12395_cov_129.196405_4_plen_144_part_00
MGYVAVERLGQVGQIVDPEILNRGRGEESEGVGIHSCRQVASFPVRSLDSVQIRFERIALLLRQHVADDHVPARFEVQSLCGRVKTIYLVQRWTQENNISSPPIISHLRGSALETRAAAGAAAGSRTLPSAQAAEPCTCAAAA